MNTEMRPDAASILETYNKLKSCDSIASDFGVNLKPHCEAAAGWLGSNPSDTLSKASSSSLEELKKKIEVLAKGAISALCKSQVDYYKSEFHRRMELIAESSELESLSESVDAKYNEAVRSLGSPQSHTFGEFWNISSIYVQFLICSANLISRHGALSAIAMTLGQKEESTEISSETSTDLLSRAKGALKIDAPKELLTTEEINRIKNSYVAEITAL